MLLMLLQDLFDQLQWFSVLVWSLVPPMALLLIYHRRIRAAPPLRGTVVLFWLGMLAGLVAWAIVALFDQLIQSLPAALSLSRSIPEQSLFRSVLWQTAVVAPTAEACKIAAVIAPLNWLIRKYRRLPAQPSTVLLATVAVSLGFAAQMSLVALWYGRESVINVLLMLPMQAIFSSSWGFALGFALSRMNRHLSYSTKLTMHGWLAACLCHGVWNGIMELSRSPGQLTLWSPLMTVTSDKLLYLLFPWALWLWWQTEQMLARAQGEVSPRLVTGQTTILMFAQYAASFACLILGGTALNALRDFGNSLDFTWNLRMTFDRASALMLGQELLKTAILAMVALFVFYQLRRRSD